MTGSNSVWYQIRDFLFLLKFRLTTLKLYKLSAYASLNLSKSESNSLASRFECCYTFAYNLVRDTNSLEETARWMLGCFNR